MGIFRVPAGSRGRPHYHDNCESALYMLSGAIEIRWGDKLQQALTVEAGDMLYVPPRETHTVQNLSDYRPRRVRRRPRLADRGLRRGALGGPVTEGLGRGDPAPGDSGQSNGTQ